VVVEQGAAAAGRNCSQHWDRVANHRVSVRSQRGFCSPGHLYTMAVRLSRYLVLCVLADLALRTDTNERNLGPQKIIFRSHYRINLKFVEHFQRWKVLLGTCLPNVCYFYALHLQQSDLVRRIT
jgi:hypothetical protein